MALPPELFKRLSRLNRELLRARLTTADRVRAPSPPGTEGADGPAARLESLVPGEERRSGEGRFYLVRRRLDEFWPGRADAGEDMAGGADVAAHYRRILFGAGRAVGPDDLHEAVRPLVASDPSGLTYMDIETCGLAGEPLFLVGLMRWREETLLVEQFLARDYSEERALLAAAWDAMADTACLVTFNGKTFDLPTMEARSLACGLFNRPRACEHVDLLAEARRRWKRALPNCRLQTIEQLVCGRHRVGDIPGGDIPAAYHEFVRAHQDSDPVRRTRSLRRIQTILHHNALDLVTMAELVAHILSSGR